MSVLEDHVVFKGKIVFNQIKIIPSQAESTERCKEDTNEVDAHVVANENSSKLTCYAVKLHPDGASFSETWSLEFDKVHDFGFLQNNMYVADGKYLL